MRNNNKCQLTGHAQFDELLARLESSSDDKEQEALQAEIWEHFGTTGAVLISDMASFSSTSRRSGIRHYLKLIRRARRLVAPVIAANNGTLLKCDADNCYAFFANVDDAIRALREGAFDFVPKPLQLFEVSASLQRIAQRRSIENKAIALENRLEATEGPDKIIVETKAKEKVKKMIAK